MMTRSGSRQLVRFVIVGVFNTAFAYGVYALLLALGLHFTLANFGALVFGILISFYSQGRFVFRNLHVQRFPRFLAVWGSLYVVNIALIAGFVGFGFDPYVGGALALPIITVLSFLLQRFFVFSSGRPPVID
ncbi:MAG: GtrA family protein [Azoarcus sp.]|nr:GtrA family protein [Azoarcus sp.]